MAEPTQFNSNSFLRRESYIRKAGILLVLSPFGNFLWSASFTNLHHWWYPHALWLIAKGVSGVLWFLWSSAFLAGLMMLKGKRSSWTFTLCIIGMNIVFGIMCYKRDIQAGAFQPTLSLLINLGLFALIYSQEFHQRLEKKLLQARMNRPFAVAVQTSLVVDFDGYGTWAKITEITHTGIRVQSMDGNAPRQIEFRTVELVLAKDLALEARFSAKIGPDFVFRFTNLNPARLAALHRWAQRIAAKKPLNQTAQSGPSVVTPSQAA
jgi:hypothetical protein